MSTDEQQECRSKGPHGLTCTRMDEHSDGHVAYERVDGDLNRVEWWEVNAIGEPK